MKNLALLLIFSLLYFGGLLAQSASGSFTQTPCNNDGVFQVTAVGFQFPITFTYYFDGNTEVHTVAANTDQLTNIPLSPWGSVSCNVSDGTNSTWVSGQYNAPFNFNPVATNAVCPSAVGQLEAFQTSGSGGPYSFLWTEVQSGTALSGNPVQAPLGEYFVEITDQSTGCVMEITDSSLFVEQNSNIQASFNNTPAACTNGSSTVTASGTQGPYAYQWSTGATSQTISGLTAGMYQVQVTDGQGCVKNFTTFIQQNPFITVQTTETDATCQQNDGSAFAFGQGGNPPYSYAWSNGQTTQEATGLFANTSYQVVVTDVNGCIGNGYVYLNSSTPITVTQSTTPSSCTSPTGSISLNATGGTQPYTYTWNTTSNPNTPTHNNLSQGNYSFTVSDAQGCIRSGSVFVPPVSNIDADITSSTVICPNTTGSLYASVSGSNPPFTYSWNTGATTSSIHNQALGSYSCTITDDVGCSKTVGEHLGSTSPLHLGVSTSAATCIYTNDGTATTNVNGGQAPYTFAYSNGDNTQQASGLGEGHHSVTVTDNQGCSKSENFYVHNNNSTDDCYCIVDGYVYLDDNDNCTFDGNETGIENIRINCAGFGSTFTDANGYYSFKLPTGSYTLSQQVNNYYPVSPCQNNSIPVNVTAASGCVTSNNFANKLNELHDLRIITMTAGIPPVPGNNYSQRVVVLNDGTMPEANIHFNYEHDGQLNYNNSNHPGMTQPSPIVRPNYFEDFNSMPSLNPGESYDFRMYYSTPTNIPAGTELVFFDTTTYGPIAQHWLWDYSPWNNVNTHRATVVSSYDPNFKEVSPKGLEEEGYFPSTVNEFDYTIHFQNEGTYFAQKIVITDQLDDDLDWSTLRPGYSPYEYTTTISESGLVTFTFDGINLPWKSQYGDELSSSFIHYSIRRKDNLAQGTEITNTAYIYFDYNPPIITNTTLNTLNDAVASLEAHDDDLTDDSDLELKIYPNPASEVVNIKINEVQTTGNARINVINLMGQTVQENTVTLSAGSNKIKLKVNDLAKGNYLVQVNLQDGTSMVKHLVIH